MRISQLRVGEVTLPPDHPRAGSDYPLYSYVIHHPDGPIIVDTGIQERHPWIDANYRPSRTSLTGLLADLALEPADITMVINTHLHFDHIGGNHLFRGVPVVAQAAEYAAASRPGFTVPEWLEFSGVVWSLVDGAATLRSGVAVLPTPSHTPGHQSVVVDFGDHVEVIAGQALHCCEELQAEASTEKTTGGLESFATVAKRIKSVEPAFVWFSHDARPWPC